MDFGHPSRESDADNERLGLMRRITASLEALSGIGPERAASFSEQLAEDHRLTFNLGQAIYSFFRFAKGSIVLPGEEDKPVKDLSFFKCYGKSPTEPKTPVIKALSALRGMGESLAMSVIENATYNQLLELQRSLGALVDYLKRTIGSGRFDVLGEEDGVPNHVIAFSDRLAGQLNRMGGGNDRVVILVK